MELVHDNSSIRNVLIMTYDVWATQNWGRYTACEISFQNANTNSQQFSWLYTAFTRIHDLDILHLCYVQNSYSLTDWVIQRKKNVQGNSKELLCYLSPKAIVLALIVILLPLWGAAISFPDHNFSIVKLMSFVWGCQPDKPVEYRIYYRFYICVYICLFYHTPVCMG